MPCRPAKRSRRPATPPAILPAEAGIWVEWGGTAIVRVNCSQVTVSSNPLVLICATGGIRRGGTCRPDHPVLGSLRQEIER